MHVPATVHGLHGTNEWRLKLYRDLNITFGFRQAPGGNAMVTSVRHGNSWFTTVINKIVQASGLVAVASAAVGGHPDSDEPGEMILQSIATFSSFDNRTYGSL
jgi:hypothetical protein